jgi:hypothetical protein
MTTKTPKEKIDNTQLLKDTGLRVRHFNGSDRFGLPRTRNMTIAYREGHTCIEIATAIVHPSDYFCRKVGTKLAVEAFQQGKTTIIPKSTSYQDAFNDKARPLSACATLGELFG